MKERHEQFFQKMKEVHLSPHTKDAIRRSLDARMRVRHAEASHAGTGWLGIFAFRRSFSFTFLSLCVLLIGGTPWAAERALPGDALYPIKRNFNEQLARTSALTVERQAAVEVMLLERRLDEASTLIDANRLDETSEIKMEKNIDTSFGRANRYLDRLESTDTRKSEHIRARLERAEETRKALMKKRNSVKGMMEETEAKKDALGESQNNDQENESLKVQEREPTDSVPEAEVSGKKSKTKAQEPMNKSETKNTETKNEKEKSDGSEAVVNRSSAPNKKEEEGNEKEKKSLPSRLLESADSLVPGL